MKPRTAVPLVIAHVVEDCCGGAAAFVSMLIASQTSDSNYASVHLLADQKTKDEQLLKLPHAVHRYESSRNFLRALTIAGNVHNELEKINPDLVVLHSTFPGTWGRVFKGKWKIIYCAHGWSFTQNIPAATKVVYGLIEAVLSYRCDAIVSISNDEFRHAHDFGVRDHAHEVIRHGVPAAAPGTFPSLPLTPSSINLAFVGRFERQKGVDILCEIFNDQRLDHITVWLVGGDIRGVNHVAIPERQNLHTLGWLSGQQVDAVLQQVEP